MVRPIDVRLLAPYLVRADGGVEVGTEKDIEIEVIPSANLHVQCGGERPSYNAIKAASSSGCSLNAWQFGASGISEEISAHQTVWIAPIAGPLQDAVSDWSIEFRSATVTGAPQIARFRYATEESVQEVRWTTLGAPADPAVLGKSYSGFLDLQFPAGGVMRLPVQARFVAEAPLNSDPTNPAWDLIFRDSTTALSGSGLTSLLFGDADWLGDSTQRRSMSLSAWLGGLPASRKWFVQRTQDGTSLRGRGQFAIDIQSGPPGHSTSAYTFSLHADASMNACTQQKGCTGSEVCDTQSGLCGAKPFRRTRDAAGPDNFTVFTLRKRQLDTPISQWLNVPITASLPSVDLLWCAGPSTATSLRRTRIKPQVDRSCHARVS
jgi:hypothetical protein